jgi:hypothetical protein
MLISKFDMRHFFSVGSRIIFYLAKSAKVAEMLSLENMRSS